MEALAVIEAESALPGQKLTVVGDLRLEQNIPLYHRGLDTRFEQVMLFVVREYRFTEDRLA